MTSQFTCETRGLRSSERNPDFASEERNEHGLPNTHMGAFTPALYDEAQKDGWVVISMKNDWKQIFSFENK